MAFIALFIKLNFTIRLAENVLAVQKASNLQLEEIVRAEEKELAQLDQLLALQPGNNGLPANTISGETAMGQDKVKGKSIKRSNNDDNLSASTLAASNTVSSVHAGNKTAITKDSVTVSKPSLETESYALKFASPIRISEKVRIIDITGNIVVKYDQQKQPSVMKAQLLLKQVDMDSGNAVVEVPVRPLRVQIKPDNSITCTFQENAKPAINEFGLPNYQRNLSMMLTGMLNNGYLDCLAVWTEEFTSRPMNARFKIPLTKIQ